MLKNVMYNHYGDFMGNIIFMTDSTCDLNKEIIEENDIKVIPLYVNFKDKSYKDLVEITTEQLFEMVDELKELPKTSAIPVFDYIEAFKPYLNTDDEVIFLGISSKMSSSFNNARLAVSELGLEDRVHIVDSLNLSSAIGLLLLEGIKMKKEGFLAKDIVTKLNEIVPNVRCHFIIDTFDYLYKGGRCSSMSKIFGTLLKIKPMIAVKDGEMSVCQKPIGHKKALNSLIDTILVNKDSLYGDNIIITHSYAKEDAIYIRNVLDKEILDKNIIETTAGSVISSHCGKGTIGILYIVK